LVVVGFNRDGSLKSRLIRWVTGGEWSHAWIKYDSEDWGGFLVAQSSATGVVICPFEKAFKHKPDVIEYEVIDWDMTPGLRGVRSYIGAGYDYASILWNGLLLLLYRATGWEYLYKIVHRDTARVSCSEFVALAIARAAVPGSGKLDPELTTPEGLCEFCEGSEYFKKCPGDG